MSRKGFGERPECSCFEDPPPLLPGNEAHVHSSRMVRTGLIQALSSNEAEILTDSSKPSSTEAQEYY